MENIKIRQAKLSDIPQLANLYINLIKFMDSCNIKIWNKNYPIEDIPDDINSKNFYVACKEDEIVGAFSVYNKGEGEDSFKWKSPKNKSCYLGKGAVKTEFLRMGIASKMLDYAKIIALKKGANFLHCQISEINIPSKKLVEKNGFYKVDGFYKFYSPASKSNILEYGFEKEIK